MSKSPSGRLGGLEAKVYHKEDRTQKQANGGGLPKVGVWGIMRKTFINDGYFIAGHLDVCKVVKSGEARDVPKRT